MERAYIHPRRKIGPLFESKYFKDMKDPCIVADGDLWHIFGSGGSVANERWQLLHATAPDIEGPWEEQDPCVLEDVIGPHVAAPGVVYDPVDKHFHMALQEDFMAIGGSVHYLVSSDGKNFKKVSTMLAPLPNTPEAGLYDPHFSTIGGKRYLTYAAMPGVIHHSEPFIPQPDIYLAESSSGLWAGPWDRIGKILGHDEIGWHHNAREHPDYEWGIEGPQLIELPSGKVILNATCFLEEGRRGTRQRVFFACADRAEGPYDTIGPVLSRRENEWESGENGHATAIIHRDELYLFYQARSLSNPDPLENNWRYGIAVFGLDQFG